MGLKRLSPARAPVDYVKNMPNKFLTLPGVYNISAGNKSGTRLTEVESGFSRIEAEPVSAMSLKLLPERCVFVS